jgi:prepilin-type N-terminal cleavage/methylation domain-containing protein
MRNTHLGFPGTNARQSGFTLIELMIALLIFTAVGGAALSLFAQNAPLFNQQQNLAGLNIAMRNAAAQIQVDIVNGGAGYYTGVNIPNWPVGIVISNNVVSSTGDCHTGQTYGANCFDSFTVIISDPLTTPVNSLADASSKLPVTAGTCASMTTNTSSSTSIYVLPPTGVTAATYAANFKNGDQILLEKGDGSAYTTVKLTSAGAASTVGATTYVLLTHSTLTNANGTNAATDDITGMSVNSSDQTTSQFCATDWVLRLAPVKYDVDLSTASDPKLRRTVLVAGNTPSANGVTLAEQVIGFKVGASLVSGATDTSTYNFDSSTYGSGVGYDYTVVRSVMVSLIGRTPPNPDPTYVFRNTFDSGPYEVQGTSVVVNPRNMSM